MAEPKQWQHGWRGFLIGLLIASLVGFLFVAIAGRADAAYDPDERAYRDNYNAGEYKRHRNASYTRHQKKVILNKMEKAWDRRERRRARNATGNARYVMRPFNASDQWINFTHNDTCSSRITNVPDCNWHGYEMPAYYDRRAETQDKYIERVVYCGATAVVVYATGGTGAAIGAGSGLCMWGFWVD